MFNKHSLKVRPRIYPDNFLSLISLGVLKKFAIKPNPPAGKQAYFRKSHSEKFLLAK